MKKLLPLLILFLCHTMALAQKTTVRIDKMLSNIDKSSINSNILYDRVLPWSNLLSFEQGKEVKSSNFNHFKQAWSDIERASYKFKDLSLKKLKKQIGQNNIDNTVFVGIISTNLHTINYNKKALKSENGLELIDNKFKAIIDKEPFKEHQILIIAPLKSNIKTNTVIFNFNESYWFKGNGKKIEQLSLLYNSQDYLIIDKGSIINKSISISFKKSGIKKLIFKVLYTDNSTQTTSGKLYVKVIGQAKTFDALVQDFSGANGYNAPSDLAFQGYDESIAYTGHLDYRIFYDKQNNNTILNKPIIIIDGFDPEDKRKIEDSDSDLPNDDHLSMVEFMSYINGNTPISLLLELRNLGYDVIIVNHPTYTRGNKIIDGGADYIERNGLAHVGFYQHINNILATNGSNEQLVIVAPSMAGQISRYALAYMEKHNIPHNTRLWVSIDSPHLGANIPLGIQAFLDEAKEEGVDVAADFVDNQLHSAAAKQQLIEQYKTISANTPNPSYLDGRTISQGYNYNHGAPFYKQFYDNLFNNGLSGSKGYPQSLRKIALINGSLSGSKTYENPWTANVNDYYANDSQQSLNIKGFQIYRPFFINLDIHIASIETYFMPKYGQSGKIARFKKGLDDDSMYVTNNNSRGNMDNVPGGWFPSQNEMAKSTLESPPLNAQDSFWNSFGDAVDNIIEGISFLLGGDYWSLRTLKHVNSFIASYSSLGHRSPDQSWATPLNKNLICSNETPFDSYFGQEKNTQHTSFSLESVNWLLKELAGNPQEPYFPVNANNLIGQSSVCDRTNSTYTFSSCSTPENVSNWQVSSNLQIISSNGTTITVKPPSDSRSSGWIKASFNNGKSVTKNIWVGRPKSPSSSISGPSFVNTGALVSYRGSTVAGATSYTWRLPYPYQTVNVFNYFGQDWQLQAPGTYTIANTFTGYSKKEGYVQFMGKNDCGNGGAKLLYVKHGSSGGFGGGGIASVGVVDDVKEVKVYPNPVAHKTTVSLNKLTEYEGEPPTVITQIKVVDQNMNILKVYNLRKTIRDVEINVSFLKTGIFFLIVVTDHGVFVKKLMKE